MKPTLIRRDMRYWLMRPDARLRPLVLCYFVVEPGAAESRQQAALHYQDEELLLPDGHSEIIFNLGAAYERRQVSQEGRSRIMARSYLIGGRSHSVLTRNLGDVRLAGVKLDPRALHRLIGTPLAEFRDSTLPLADLNDSALLDLEDAIAGAGSAAKAASVLDRFFLNAMRNAHGTDPLVDHLLQKIHDERGLLAIMKWGREQRIDSRTLERRFCTWTGMTPKRYARVIRFKHSYHRLISGAGGCGAISPHLDGYYDQSHFHREFRHFTGTVPNAKLNDSMQQGTSVTDHLISGEFGSQR